MKRIFIAGAGLSTSSLIEYLLENSAKYNWHITVGDISLEQAQSQIQGYGNADAIAFNVFDQIQRQNIISKSDLVVSMLPATMHPMIAKCCVKYRKNMVTASYVSEQLKSMDEAAIESDILILNEVGLDPGIDHMSAMELIDDIKGRDGKIISFKSFAGGLIAPKYDNNPWNYKFTWNPRNVILAGQGVSKLITDGKYKYIPYHKLFERTGRVHILDYGEFEAYPNRDSLEYREAYGLKDIPTMFRGTLRRPGFCKAWRTFVLLGATDDTYTLENSENMTYREFINTFLRFEPAITVENKLSKYMGIDEDSYLMYQLRWLGIFERRKIGLKNASPAQILQHLLQGKWEFEERDRDMIVMQHQIGYEIEDTKDVLVSSLVVEGDDKHTAMSKTVGYPAAIASKHILLGNIKAKGVQIPTLKNIYKPILSELAELNIKFEKDTLVE